MPQAINYYSTNLAAPKVSFKEALLKGLAPDRGLYMPERIPQISVDQIDQFTAMSYHEIAYAVTNVFLQGELPDNDLKKIVKEAYNYHVPLENVSHNRFIMRLDQGPTASFKDFAARMMGRLINYYLEKENRKLLILTATSGDTGSAIANAFYELDNINVVVLFPEKEVTSRQRKQMTTLGKNIQIIALPGKFDDCQTLVKQAFSDPELEHLNLSSANSINIGRLIPQIVYYFYAFAKLRSGKAKEKVLFSVPSGNFGNMMGGMLAKNMGLPVEKFIIATNENDEFPKFMETGSYSKIQPSINCVSSAMNVGHPSNLARLIALYGGVMDEKGTVTQMPNMEKMKNDIHAVSITDKQTRETIKHAYNAYNVLLEPHGAAGWAGAEDFLSKYPQYNNNQLLVSLETAHPAKFPEEINKTLGIDPQAPPSLTSIEDKKEWIKRIDNHYDKFKSFLLEHF